MSLLISLYCTQVLHIIYSVYYVNLHRISIFTHFTYIFSEHQILNAIQFLFQSIQNGVLFILAVSTQILFCHIFYLLTNSSHHFHLLLFKGKIFTTCEVLTASFLTACAYDCNPLKIFEKRCS